MQELAPASAIPTGPPAVPVGVPSDLLRRRPDIRRAEANIHAATARIGVAAADLFPKFSITGSAGLQGRELEHPVRSGQPLLVSGTVGTWPLFNMGRNRSAVEVQKALQEQSVITYRQTVLAALQEVENALIASAKEQEHERALVEAVAANRKAVDLATRLYTEGQTDFLNVLTGPAVAVCLGRCLGAEHGRGLHGSGGPVQGPGGWLADRGIRISVAQLIGWGVL